MKNVKKELKKELKKEKEMPKKRTLNEIRQVKDSVYTPPKTINNYYGKVNFDPQYLVDLIKNFPNDYDLGGEFRKYFLSLKQNSQ